MGLPDLRHQAGYDYLRQGALVGIPADLGGDDLGADLAGDGEGKREDRRFRSRFHLFRAPGRRGGGVGDVGDLRGAGHRRTRARRRPVAPGRAPPLRRSSAGRRGSRHRSGRRRGAGRQQGDEATVRVDPRGRRLSRQAGGGERTDRSAARSTASPLRRRW